MRVKQTYMYVYGSSTVYIVQCPRWTAFLCLFTHPNVKGPHFFRIGRIKVLKLLKYKC